MPQPTAICVYCGSSSGRHPEYAEQARAFGTEMARRGIALVYGGGKVGLMGVVADAVLAGGGRVIGVIPRQLVELEVAHPGLSELAFLDVRGYYRDLRAMMDHMVDERFVRPEQRDSIWFGDDMGTLFDWMQAYQGSYIPKWIDTSSVSA